MNYIYVWINGCCQRIKAVTRKPAAGLQVRVWSYRLVNWVLCIMYLELWPRKLLKPTGKCSSRESQEPHSCQAELPSPVFHKGSNDHDKSICGAHRFQELFQRQPPAVNPLTVSILQMWKLRHRGLQRQGSWAQHLIAFITSSLQQPRGTRYQPGLEALGKAGQSIYSLIAGPKA